MCRNIQTVCKRSDIACYSSPCAKAAPDLYTIIDDDLADDLVYKAAPSVVSPQETSGIDTIGKMGSFQDDADGDYLNALPIAESLVEGQDSTRRETRSKQTQSHRAVVSPVVNQGQFVSVHSAQDDTPSKSHFLGLEAAVSGRTLLAGLVMVWMAVCVLALCLRKQWMKRDRIVDKDGATMMKVEDESDDSCDEPDEYQTTPSPPLMQEMVDEL